MKITKTKIEGLLIFEPQIFEDDRGSFFESWNENVFKKYLKDIKFVQDNQSISKKNCLRGLHFQDPPYAQGKLVRVIKGSVLDVAVDLRKKSKTYGQHEKVILSSTNNKIFWIPEGFAHGFYLLKRIPFFHTNAQIFTIKSQREQFCGTILSSILIGVLNQNLSSQRKT